MRVSLPTYMARRISSLHTCVSLSKIRAKWRIVTTFFEKNTKRRDYLQHKVIPPDVKIFWLFDGRAVGIADSLEHLLRGDVEVERCACGRTNVLIADVAAVVCQCAEHVDIARR